MTTLALGLEEVFSHALRGEECFLISPDTGRWTLPVEDWTRAADEADQAIVSLCAGPTLDVGCGPGRMTVELVARGHIALGIDIVSEAVGQTRRRGSSALRRDVFAPIPGEGRWQSALLADGNIGIGGDPATLLDRVRRLLAPGGSIVVEVAPPGVRSQRLRPRLQCACGISEPFGWATLGLDGVPATAAQAGLVETRRLTADGRWAVVLTEASR